MSDIRCECGGYSYRARISEVDRRVILTCVKCGLNFAPQLWVPPTIESRACRACGVGFSVGPGTGFRTKRVFCSDKCRYEFNHRGR